MTDQNDIPASPSLEELMREALASVQPPKELRGQILAALQAEKKRARLHALYRRAGIIAAAVLILVPAVTLPIFRTTRDAAPETDTCEAVLGVTPTDGVGPADGILCDTAGSATTEEITNESLVLFSTTAAAPMYATQPKSTAPAAEEDKILQAPADAAEPAYFAVLKNQVGDDAFAQWLAAYEGDLASPEAEAAAYAYFGLDE